MKRGVAFLWVAAGVLSDQRQFGVLVPDRRLEAYVFAAALARDAFSLTAIPCAARTLQLTAQNGDWTGQDFHNEIRRDP